MQALPGYDLCAESEGTMEDEELEPVNCAAAVRAIKDETRSIVQEGEA